MHAGSNETRHNDAPVTGPVTQPPRWQALFAELKRRRVFRVMTMYGVAGFAVLQVADLLVPVLLLPDWAYRLVGLLLLAGFPLVITLAWVFDFTPDGVRRTGRAAATEIRDMVAAPRRQRWPAGLLALGGTILLLTAGWYALRPGSPAPDGPASLAVLPFANLTQSVDSEPFVDGVHDDLLTQLSRVGSLRVISRTSVQGYRGSARNVREIAAELGVRWVLTGGVQRSGEQLRMNVQLIDARIDEHVWAETYNRVLTVANVFAIQSEIAESITRALRTRLSPEEQRSIAERPTESLEAYDHYQRGTAFFRRALVTPDVWQAVREFEAAVLIDPAFSDAWAQLAIARATLSWDLGIPVDAATVQDAVRRADALAPDRLSTHLARGYYHYYMRRDYDAALVALRQAEALAPGDPEVLLPAGWVLRRQGRWEEAYEKFRAAFDRDPRNWDNAYASIGLTLAGLHRFDEAARYAELATSVAPDLPPAYVLLALSRLLQDGDTAAAATAIDRGGQRTHVADVLLGHPLVARTMAYRYGDRIRATTSAIASDTMGLRTQWLGHSLTPAAYFLNKAQVLRVLGDAGAARAHFDSARIVLEARLGTVPTRVLWGQQGTEQSSLGLAYAGLGRREDAIRLGREALDVARSPGDAFVEPMIRASLAEIYVMVGEHDSAIAQLERLVQGHSWVSSRALTLDPIWQPLHTHPGFNRMVRPRD
jgi:TolB-like protein/Tfp pilus assembly protein PilF